MFLRRIKPTVLLTLFLLTYSGAALSQVEFTRHTIFQTLRGAYWVYAEDVDRDGDLDLVTAAFDGIDWWENDGFQNFTKRPVGFMQGAWSAHAGDMDGDGDIDILSVTPADDEVVLWKNNGSQSFSKKIIDSQGLDPETVFIIDLDNDGDKDILTAHWEDGQVNWYENQGGSIFDKHTIDANLKGAHSVHAADFNGDGLVDIVGSGSSQMRWYANNGSGTFTSKTIGAVGALCVYAADIDGDGDMDVLRTQRDNGDVDWFENDGTGLFTERTIEAGYGDCWSVRAGDIDGDGDLDVAAAGFGPNNIKVWFNDGVGNFGSGLIVEEVDTPRFIQIVDLDGDGDGDIAAAIRDDRDLVWYEVLGDPKSLTMSSPAGGDTLVAESMFEIQWQTTGPIDSVKLEFSVDSGGTWSTIVADIPNEGNYAWSVPDTSSSQCLVRVTGGDPGDPSANTGSFTILREAELPRKIIVLAPNGGEQVPSDSNFVIFWFWSGLFDTASIELSLDNGSSWSTIVGQTVNNGVFEWVTPDTTADSCLVRISDASSPEISDVSNSIFAIVEPPQIMTLIAPNGSEILIQDSTFTIQWQSSGQIDSVLIEFSADGGVVWSALASSISNDSVYDWNVPDTLSESCLIRVSDARDGAPLDESDAFFAIRNLASFAPVITAITPNTGPPGAAVVIDGSNFLNVTEVAFNGRQSGFTIDSDARISTAVPLGASSGKVTVANFAGVAESPVDFTIRAASDTTEVTFLPTDDGQVKLTEPTRNYGDKDSFKAEAGTFNSFLKFEVTGLAGAVLEARLQLHVQNASDKGGDIYLVANNFQGTTVPWNEDELNADNAPLVTGSPFDSLAAVAIGDTVEFDLSSAIAGNGTYSFAISSISTNRVEFDSKENNIPPRLILVCESVSNLTPFAGDDSVQLNEDTTAIFDVLSNDVDADGIIDSGSVAIVMPPSHGAAEIDPVAGTIAYTPNPDFAGADSLSYQVQDNVGTWSNVARVLIAVHPVNDAPVARDDTAATLQGQAVSINLLQNDFDIDGQVILNSITVMAAPLHGEATLSDSLPGFISYAPQLEFSGIDTLTYTVSDDSGAVSNEAFVFIAVQGVNQPPYAADDSVQTPRNQPIEIEILANDMDPEGAIDVTSITITTPPVTGDLFVQTLTGFVTYTPATDFFGVDSFAYTIQDTGGLSSNEATVFVEVQNVNHPPEIQEFLPTDFQLQLHWGNSIHFSVRAVDSDNDSLSYKWWLSAASGSGPALVSTATDYDMATADLDPDTYTVRAEIHDSQSQVSLEWTIDVIVTSVELSSLAADFDGFNGVSIFWTTSREVNTLGFNVLRSDRQNGSYSKLNKEVINSNSKRAYTFIDLQVEVDRRYFYILEDVSLTGSKSEHGPISVEVTAPATFELSQNFPNPFNPETKIRFQLPEAGRVVFKVYDILGREVRTLLNGERNAGFHTIVWDANDNSGRKVGSGSYYYRLEFQGSKKMGSMLLLK